MASRKKILFPRSDIPGRAPTLNEIDFGEIAINTHDGKAFIKRENNGEVSIQSIGSENVENVYYVSKSGVPGNDGKSLMNSFATLDSAVAVVYAKENFKFDTVTCERDLHLIMDSIRFDMVLGTNYGAITAGQAYKRGNAKKVTSEQLYQTRRSINEERLGMVSVPQVKTDLVAKARVQSGYDEIIELLIGGLPSTVVYPDPPVEAQTDANLASQAILDNKDAIQDAVLDYLNNPNNFLTGSYDATTCSRDVGLIINAVARDILLGTDYNTVTAGWAYNRSSSAYVLSDQNEATIAGINFARDYIIGLAGVTSDTDIENLFKNVTDVINKTQTVYPTINYPQTALATYQTADRIAATTNIQANRATLIADTTKFINNNYTGIGATCERDLGLIIDAVARDLITGSDFWTIAAGNSYLRANSAYVLSDQSAVTIAVIEHARDLIKALPAVTSDALIDTFFKRVTDSIDGTITAVQNYTTFPATGTYASSQFREVDHGTIRSQRSSLITQVTTFISTTYPELVYDVAKCERDTGFVIDAINIDLLYGGNTASRNAALSYFSGAVAQLGAGEGTSTVAAYNYLAGLIKSYTSENARVDELMGLVTGVITAGNTGSLAAEVEISITGITNTEYDAIIAAQTTLVADTLLYGQTNYSFYDQAKCERDVGYILDGLSHDVQYGGNTATLTNALAYFSGTVAQLGVGEVPATVAAYNDLKTRINLVVTTAPEQTVIGGLVDEITGVITAGNTTGLATEVNIVTTGLTTTEYDAIVAGIVGAQAATIDYVDLNWATQLGGYNAAKCARDVGLILDAVRRDLIIGGDFWTITAGNSYLRANTAYLLGNQKQATIDAVTFARDQVKALTGVTSDSTVDTLFERVIDVLDGTITTVQPVTTWPVSGTYASTKSAQRQAILAARTTLIDDTTTYISSNYDGIGFEYDRVRCERDVGLIIDAVSRDLILGTDYNTVTAGNAYQRANSAYVLSAQKQVTIDAVNLARDTLIALPGVTSDATIISLFATITSYISDTPPAYPTISYPTTPGSTYQSADRISASSAIQANRASLITDTTTFINDNYTGIGTTCIRDLGFIIDAVARDLITGSDFWTLTAGNAYLRANSAYVLSNQSDKTVQVINYARDLIKALPAVTSDALIDTLFKRVTDCVDGTVSTVINATTFPFVGTYANAAGRSIQITDIVAARSNLISVSVTGYITATYPLLNYDSAKCERDAGFVIDAICADLLYGGNSASRQAAISYFVGAASQLGSNDEKVATVATFNNLAGDIKALVNVTEDSRIDELMGLITGVITAGNISGIAAEVEISTAGLSTTEYDAIVADKSTTISSSITWGRENLSFYDQAKCERDVGYILDGLSHDVKYGGNTATRTNAISYFVGAASQLGAGEGAATIAAYNNLKTLLDAVVSTSPEQTVVGSLVDEIVGVITAGNITGLSAEVGIQTGGLTTTESDIMVAAKATTQDIVLAYVDTFAGYDVAKCERDTGFLIDALVADLTYSGNSASRQVAFAYFVGTSGQLGAGESLATVDAYNDLATRIKALANVTDDSIIDTLVAITTDVITAGNVNGVPAEIDISTAGLTSTEFDAIKSNTLIIQNDTIDFVNDENLVGNFDQHKCERDTGLIIDAIALDLQNNTDYNSITAGLAYQRGNAQKVQSDQLQYTVDSINHLRDRINASGINGTSQTFVTARIKQITQLLEESSVYGNEDGTVIDFTGSGSENADKRNAANALIVNRRTIQNQLITWIENNFESLEYNDTKCKRDVGYIVDALTHDILFDGSFATDTNARSYWVGRDLNIENTTTTYESLDGLADIWTNQLGDGEITASLAAYEQLKTIINKYITTSTEELRVNTLIDVIRTSINAVDGSGITVTLPTITGESNIFYATRSTLQQQVVFYANSVFPTFSYNQATCRRDVGYILDALVYDLKYGGNSATSTAQRAYFSIFNNGYGDLLGESEINATIAAYGQLKSIIAGYTVGTDSGNITKIQNLLDIIILAVQQSSVGTYQLGDFFGAGTLIYQYNYPTGLAAGFDTLVFPDPVALGYDIIYPTTYNAFIQFNPNTAIRRTIITQSSETAQNQGTDTTIFLKSGDYTVNNPIKLPPKTAIIGDALRSTTIRPRNVDSDIFWVDNGCYVKEITFRDHQNGAACVAFDPRNNAQTGPFITQSPYVQNCTSLTTSGIGMKIDGSKVSGLRSMVLDAFTQFNADGIGVFLKERAYAQLVSCFTISTATSIKAESGAQCSVTNSNSSFGDYGLVATGGSKSIYNGLLHADYNLNDDVLRINGIVNTDSANYSLEIGDYKRPNYNDAIKFENDSYYYTVLNVSDEILQNWTVSGNTDQVRLDPNVLSDNDAGQRVVFSKNDGTLAIANLGARRIEIRQRDEFAYPWSQDLTPTNPVDNTPSVDNFGNSLSISTDGLTVVAGAPSNQYVQGSSTGNHGAAYVFQKDGASYTQKQFIQDSVTSSPNPNENRFMGSEVKLSGNGNVLVVSNQSDSDAGFTNGVVAIYSRDSANDPIGFVKDQKLFFPKGTPAGTYPRTAISETGTDLLVSWKGNTVYYYTKNQFGSYSISQNITSQLSQNANAVYELAMNGDASYAAFTSTDVAETFIDSAIPQFSGSVFLDVNDTSKFQVGMQIYSGTSLTLQYPGDQRIPIGTKVAGISSPTRLELDQATTGLWDGDFDYIFGFYPNQGGVEFFRFNEGSWNLQETMYPSDGREDTRMGISIDMNSGGDIVAVGQNRPNDGDNTLDAASTYLFERGGTNWTEVSILRPINQQYSGDGFGSPFDDRFGTSVAVGGTADYIIVGSPQRLVESQTDGATFAYSSILPETGSYEISIAPPLNKNATLGSTTDFHQRSLISASSHTFEFVGAGTNMFAAVPQNGGIPIKDNEIRFDSAESLTPNFGLVYFTATDELGDFRIGGDLTINRESGTITGTTFDRSLFAVLTPYILALEG
tara:strand:+ start:5475 stop:14351 length:8877 start_codon:yes stop_codon:yes gene_type:complete